MFINLLWSQCYRAGSIHFCMYFLLDPFVNTAVQQELNAGFPESIKIIKQYKSSKLWNLIYNFNRTMKKRFIFVLVVTSTENCDIVHYYNPEAKNQPVHWIKSKIISQQKVKSLSGKWLFQMSHVCSLKHGHTEWFCK